MTAALHLLAKTGWQPGGTARSATALGNQAVEHLLLLRAKLGEACGAGESAGLDLSLLAVGVEVLAELQALDRFSLSNLVGELVQTAEARAAVSAGPLGATVPLSVLQSLARAVAGLAVVSANGSLTPSRSMRVLAAWRLLTLRMEAGQLHAPGMARTLSYMWTSSCLLSAAVGSSSPCSFRLPGALGLTAAAAWSQEEHRGFGVSRAQLRVVAALARLGFPPQVIDSGGA